MTIHREGYKSIGIVFLLGLLLCLSAAYCPHSWVFYTCLILSVFLLLIVVQFFRNPTRKHTLNPNAIISPADGKVVVIEEVFEDEFLNEKCLQVSVFMSPFNVHINRYPIDGQIAFFRYHPGNYLVAWHPKASTENERTTCVIKDHKGRGILFRQIAGALARRIVFYGKEGAYVKQNSECGFIKFGSRVDIFLPLQSKIAVTLGQKVKGGVSILAELPE